MRLEAVAKALDAFIGAAEPRSLALVGPWGLGKTFYWQGYLTSRERKHHKAASYAYVSLFGLKDLRDVQDALVASSRRFAEVSEQEGMSQSGLLARARRAIGRTGATVERQALSHVHLLEKLPNLAELGQFARAVAFQFVNNSLICFDDVERRSGSLPLKEFLGLVSMLREQRGCRVLVIMNTDALSPEDRDELKLLREKVFDGEVVFDPSSAECAGVAFPPGNGLYEIATTRATRLDIRNIRVLFRIRRLLDAVSELAMEGDDELQAQIVHSSVLLGWCYNSGDGKAPPFEYVKRLSYASFLDVDKNNKRPDEEVGWNRLLADYEYMDTDELDLAICEVLERGYVDTHALSNVLSNRAEALRRSRLERDFQAAWGLYHGSFDPSPEALITAFDVAVKAGAEVISSVNMSGTSMLLRSLGYGTLADELLSWWIEVKERVDPAALNIRASDWQSEIRDEELRALAQAAFDRLPRPAKSLRETALALAEQRGWSEADELVLQRAKSDEFYELFKTLTYPHTGAVIRQLLRFSQFNHLNVELSRVGAAVREALLRIASESDLNHRRVAGFLPDLKTLEDTQAAKQKGETTLDSDEAG